MLTPPVAYSSTFISLIQLLGVFQSYYNHRLDNPATSTRVKHKKTSGFVFFLSLIMNFITQFCGLIFSTAERTGKQFSMFFDYLRIANDSTERSVDFSIFQYLKLRKSYISMTNMYSVCRFPLPLYLKYNLSTHPELLHFFLTVYSASESITLLFLLTYSRLVIYKTTSDYMDREINPKIMIEYESDRRFTKALDLQIMWHLISTALNFFSINYKNNDIILVLRQCGLLVNNWSFLNIVKAYELKVEPHKSLVSDYRYGKYIFFNPNSQFCFKVDDYENDLIYAEDVSDDFNLNLVPIEN